MTKPHQPPSLFVHVLLAVAAVSLLLLIALRIGRPEDVVKTDEGFVLNVLSASAFYFALAEWAGVPQGVYRAGTGLVLVSTFTTAVFVDLVLNLGYLVDERGLGLLWVLVLSFAAVSAFGWWQVIYNTRPTLRVHVRPLFILGMAVVAVAVVYVTAR